VKARFIVDTAVQARLF